MKISKPVTSMSIRSDEPCLPPINVSYRPDLQSGRTVDEVFNDAERWRTELMKGATRRGVFSVSSHR
jgi:hypothetical protein